MTLVTMSNPPGLGLDLAVIGNPPKRKGNRMARRYTRRSRAVYRPKKRLSSGWYVMGNPSMMADTRAMLEGSSAYAGPEYGTLGGRTKAQRRAAAKKGAATRKRNQAKRKAAARKAAKTRARKSTSRHPSRSATRVGTPRTKKVRKSKKKGAKMATKTKRSRGKARTPRGAALKGWRTRRRKAGARAAKRWLNRRFTNKSGTRKARSTRVYKSRRGRVKPRKLYGKYGGRRGTRTIAVQEWRKGKRGSKHRTFTNPPRRRRRASMRRNPTTLSLRGYTSGLTGALPTAWRQIKAKPVTHGAMLIGGMAATYLAGGFITAGTIRFIAQIPGVGNVVGTELGRRVVGGLVPYTLGYAAQFLIPKRYAGMKSALLTGGAIASIVSIIAPTALDLLLAPVLGPVLALKLTDAETQAAAASNGTNGLGAYAVLAGHAAYNPMLAGYVSAPSYAGAGAYVEAPAYAGAGADPTVLAGYVEAPAYAGAGGMDGYLDQSYLTNGYLNADPAVAGGAYG